MDLFKVRIFENGGWGIGCHFKILVRYLYPRFPGVWSPTPPLKKKSTPLCPMRGKPSPRLLARSSASSQITLQVIFRGARSLRSLNNYHNKCISKAGAFWIFVSTTCTRLHYSAGPWPKFKKGIALLECKNTNFSRSLRSLA